MEDITAYGEQLYTIAFKILKDEQSADDVVQNTYLEALEKNALLEFQLKEICQQLAFKELNYRRHGIDAPMAQLSWAEDDEEQERFTWGRIAADTGEVPIIVRETIQKIVTTTTDYKGRWMSYEQAQAYITNLNLHTNTEYLQWHKQHPEVRIPARLQVYTEYTTWEAFIGKGYPKYDDFVTYCRNTLLPMDINTEAKYKEWAEQHRPLFPKSPHVVYGKAWEGWTVIFGKVARRTDVLGYDEAKVYVQNKLVPIGINTLDKWTKRKAEIPPFLPTSPFKYYQTKGWVDSKDFFGTNLTKVCAKQTFIPYKHAREWVRLNLRSIGIVSRLKFLSYLKGEFEAETTPIYPTNMPKAPQQTYKKEGFTWGDFLGTQQIAYKKRKLWNYKKAQAWVYANVPQIKKEHDWFCYCKGEFPELPPKPMEIPVNVRQYYAKKGWRNWFEWFGVKKIIFDELVRMQRKRLTLKEKKEQKYLPTYQQAKEYIIEYLVPQGITNARKYRALKQKPKCLPTDLIMFYKDKGFVNLSDMFGKGVQQFQRTRNNRTKFLSYEEASEYVRKYLVPIGISSLRKICQYEELPTYIPRNPNHYYKDSGWVNTFAFFGVAPYGEAGDLPKYSYEAAQRWVLQNIPSVKSSVEWRKWTSGKLASLPTRPSFIPALPDVSYKNKGWSGWSDFLRRTCNMTEKEIAA